MIKFRHFTVICGSSSCCGCCTVSFISCRRSCPQSGSSLICATLLHTDRLDQPVFILFFFSIPLFTLSRRNSFTSRLHFVCRAASRHRLRLWLRLSRPHCKFSHYNRARLIIMMLLLIIMRIAWAVSFLGSGLEYVFAKSIPSRSRHRHRNLPLTHSVHSVRCRCSLG